MGTASEVIQMGENRNGWRRTNLSTFGRKRSMNVLPAMSRIPVTPMTTRLGSTARI